MLMRSDVPVRDIVGKYFSLHSLMRVDASHDKLHVTRMPRKMPTKFQLPTYSDRCARNYAKVFSISFVVNQTRNDSGL
jgi:hypothetical protein